jgi:hypothetical protein
VKEFFTFRWGTRQNSNGYCLLDAAAQRLSYTLLTTMSLRALGSNQAELAWSATFEPDGIPASEAMEMLEGALAANCVALKQFMEAGRK